jgi:hypothetical protein
VGSNTARIGERSYEKEHDSHRGSIAQCRMRLQTLGARMVGYGASESYVRVSHMVLYGASVEVWIGSGVAETVSTLLMSCLRTRELSRSRALTGPGSLMHCLQTCFQSCDSRGGQCDRWSR